MRKPKTSRYRKRVASPKTLPKWSDYIPVGAAASFVTDFCKPKTETRRDFRNKASARIRYAIKRRELSERKTGLLFEDLIRWGMTKRAYQKGLSSLPIPQRVKTIGIPSPELDSPRAALLPARLQESNSALREAYRRIAELEAENAALSQTIINDAPFTASGRKVRRSKRRVE